MSSYSYRSVRLYQFSSRRPLDVIAERSPRFRNSQHGSETAFQHRHIPPLPRSPRELPLPWSWNCSRFPEEANLTMNRNVEQVPTARRRSAFRWPDRISTMSDADMDKSRKGGGGEMAQRLTCDLQAKQRITVDGVIMLRRGEAARLVLGGEAPQ